MKKAVLCFIVLLSLVSVSFGQSLIGARAAGMGGAGVAATRDMSCAYYNPAAMMQTGKAGFIASVGAVYSGVDKLMGAASSSNDPAKFAADNFAADLNVNARINGILGASISKIGLSVLPGVMVNLQKPPASLAAVGTAGVGYTGVLTAGYTFGFSALPAIDVGANLKYLGGMGGNINVVGNIAGGANGSQTTYSQSGLGMDLGALCTINVPFLTSLSVGAVARDLGETVTTSMKQKSLTSAAGSSTLTEGPEVDLGSVSTTIDSTYVVGVAGTVPVVGATLAMDLESGKNFSNTHFGIEYPVLLNLLTLRAGLATGTNLSLTTVGAKIGIPFFTLNMAYVMDSKISNNNQYVLDIAGGF